MLTVVAAVGFALKILFTGIFLATGFAHGHILGEKLIEWETQIARTIKAYLATWPGLRDWLIGQLARLVRTPQLGVLVS